MQFFTNLYVLLFSLKQGFYRKYTIIYLKCKNTFHVFFTFMESVEMNKFMFTLPIEPFSVKCYFYVNIATAFMKYKHYTNANMYARAN